MGHPTIKQLDFVIEKLKSVLPQARKEGAFDINIGHVYSDGLLKAEYLCGTVHCTGGWYAVANLKRKFIEIRYRRGYINFRDGADLMAKDLGFETMNGLSQWAGDNPLIWDNKEGHGMFANCEAYNYLGFAGVVKQFEIVRSNLMKLKEK